MSTCPVCESYNTEEYDSYYKYSNFLTKNKCHDCTSEWTDTYKYDTSKITKESDPNEG